MMMSKILLNVLLMQNLVYGANDYYLRLYTLVTFDYMLLCAGDENLTCSTRV